MTTFYTADQHFNHQRILSLCERPFPDVTTMNETIIERWNEVVAPDDTVWVLGDFAMGDITGSLALGLRLNGTKRLILGNHDRPFMRAGKPDYWTWTQRYKDEAGFTWVGHHAGATIAGRHVHLSHFPYTGDSHDTDRYVDHRPEDDGSWLLCGHVHTAWTVNGRMINVGVDGWEFYPVPEETIHDFINAGDNT
jgi:calcineurin-like phosphoesterase family protein